jgi:hypothetical protein
VVGERGTGELIDASKVFESGSLIKVFTGTVLADMALRGEIRWAQPRLAGSSQEFCALAARRIREIPDARHALEVTRSQWPEGGDHMTTETFRKERSVDERIPESLEVQRENSLRTQAMERIHQLRRFNLHFRAFALGIPIMGVIWVLTEYFEEHTWPDRFASDPDVAGTWDPWFFFVAGIWAIILVVHAVKTYFGPTIGPVGRYIRRPVTEAEINREIARMRH